jgi:hypothetical protein
MIQVLLTGYTPEFDLHRITFVKLLQREASLPLATAKEYMERCVMGECVAVAMPSLNIAELFVRRARELGAIAEISGVQQRR